MKQAPAMNCGADWSEGGSSFIVWGSRHGAWQVLGKVSWLLCEAFQAEARQKCEPQLQGIQVSVGVQSSFSSVCSLHGSSQLIKNALLQKQKEQKCWGNLKDGSCAMYRNCDDSKSSLQASLPGNQNLMMFRLLPNFWHLRPCDCNGCSHIPVFFADNVFIVL